MYCPVDGTEWREGITRCPEHDVDLVDEPPEPEEAQPWLGATRLEGLPGVAGLAAALAGIAYAVTGTLFNLWGALSSTAGIEPRGMTVLRFAQSASFAIGLGGLASLGAAVLAKTYTRLTQPPPIPLEDEDDEDDEDDLPPEGGDTFMTVVSTLAICFAVAWVGLSVVVAWKTRTLGGDSFFGSEDDGLMNLFAYQSAAAACTAGSIAVMGALLMARVHDRLSSPR